VKFALVFGLAFGGDGGSDDPWFGADKIQHFFAAAFVQSVSYSGLRALDASHGSALTGATLTSATAGLGKEIYDWRRGAGFSVRDLVWDAAGAGAATLLLEQTRR
jgi:putative lipoprotein